MRSALHKKFLPPFKGTGLDPLMIGLESYWALDENSGTRYDSVGSNDLTDNNTVGYQNDGPRGVNANFVNNGEILVSPNINPVLSGGFSYSFWIKADAVDAAYRTPIAKDNGAPVDHQTFQLSGLFSFFISDTAGAPIVVDGPTLVANIWYHIVIWYDSSDKKAYMRVDDTTTYVSAAALVNGPRASNVPINIGAVTSGQSWKGKVSRVGFWTEKISLAEITELYNIGRGKSYADLSPGIKTNLVSYWNLDEPSAGIAAVTRVDSHGVNNLTDNNTVGSVSIGPEQVVAVFTTAGNEHLDHVYDSSLMIEGNRTYTLWFRPADNPGADRWLFVKEDLDFVCYIDAANKLHGYVYDSVVGFSEWVTSNEVFVGQWNFAAVWYDATVKHMYGQLNLAAAADGGAIVNSPRNSGNDNFTICSRNNNGTPNADLACFGIWSKVLSAPEIFGIFNNGVGKRYSDLTAAEKVNLTSYWNMTELSGNRADSHGANTLIDNNTVLSVINMPDVADKICAKFVAVSTEFLSIPAPAAGLALNDSDFTISAWFKAVTVDNLAIVSRYDPATNSEDYVIYTSAGVLKIYRGAAFANVDTGINVGDGNWHNVMVWNDASIDTVSISLDGAAAVSGVLTPPVGNNAPFNIGAYASTTSPFNGSIDEVAIWSRILTPAERTRLFNLGKGKFYPFTP